MDESDKINDELLKQVDQALKDQPLEITQHMFSSNVMDAINVKTQRVYINPVIIKLICGFFAGCILLCFYYSDLDLGSLKFPDQQLVIDAIPANLLILLLCINIIMGLFLLDRWLGIRLKSELP